MNIKASEFPHLCSYFLASAYQEAQLDSFLYSILFSAGTGT